MFIPTVVVALAIVLLVLLIALLGMSVHYVLNEDDFKDIESFPFYDYIGGEQAANERVANALSMDWQQAKLRAANREIDERTCQLQSEIRTTIRLVNEKTELEDEVRKLKKANGRISESYIKKTEENNSLKRELNRADLRLASKAADFLEEKQKLINQNILFQNKITKLEEDLEKAEIGFNNLTNKLNCITDNLQSINYSFFNNGHRDRCITYFNDIILRKKYFNVEEEPYIKTVGPNLFDGEMTTTATPYESYEAVNMEQMIFNGDFSNDMNDWAADMKDRIAKAARVPYSILFPVYVGDTDDYYMEPFKSQEEADAINKIIEQVKSSFKTKEEIKKSKQKRLKEAVKEYAEYHKQAHYFYDNNHMPAYHNYNCMKNDKMKEIENILDEKE